MPLLPEFPISGDDYTVGFITTTAGKKEFVTRDSFLNSGGGVRPGDHIYISTVGKILVIGSITGENSGTLTDPCPDDCAVTDLPVRIFFKTASSRVQGRIAMLLERLSKGYLAAFSEITAKENQFFQTTNVPGELKTVYLTADNVAETETRKFMPPTISAEIVEETDNRKIMTADERAKIAGINGLGQNDWNDGTSSTEALISPEKLRDTIKNSFGGNLDNGWTKLPNGLILQWGKLRNLNGGVAFAFPVRFPNKTGAFIAQIRTDWVSDQHFPLVYASWVDDLGGAIVWCHDLKNGNVEVLYSADVDWIAIGF